jgi:alpha-D-xyloside xylohydrolase
MAYWKDYTIMGALEMDFANDKKVKNLSSEYLFGPSLLVAPVTTYGERTKEVYLPAGGGWYDLYSGKYFEGGKTVAAEAPLGRIPLFVREGSIIPVGPDIQYAEEETGKPVTLYVYTGNDADFTLYDDENDNNDYQKGMCSRISIEYQESTGKLSIGPTDGNYPGMLSKRTFRIVWIGKSSPQAFLSENTGMQNATYLGKTITITKNK